jgi:hypothetical protein
MGGDARLRRTPAPSEGCEVDHQFKLVEPHHQALRGVRGKNGTLPWAEGIISKMRAPAQLTLNQEGGSTLPRG